MEFCKLVKLSSASISVKRIIGMLPTIIGVLYFIEVSTFMYKAIEIILRRTLRNTLEQL